MRKMSSYALAIIVFVSCNQPHEVDTKSEGEKLMQTSREWSRVASGKSADSILNYWTDDAIVLSAGDPTLRGKDAIRGMVEGSFKTPGFQISWEPKTAHVSKSGDLGYLLEETKMSYPDSTGKQVTHNFEVVTIWKKQTDGSWKCAVDVLTPSSSANR